MNKMKVLFTLLMGVLIVFEAQRAYFMKSDMLSYIYSNIVFTRLAVETQQYTRQIEYGLDNGKSLENFYHIQLILSDAKRCSSYINSVYILSEDFRLMYAFQDDENAAAPTAVRIPVGEDFFAVYEDGLNGYFLSVAISGRGGASAGYLTLGISHAITDNAIREFNRENRIQAAVIGVLTFLAGTAAMIHCCRREKRIIGDSTKTVSITVCAGAATDAAITLFKFWTTIDSMIQQSVNKITVTLQNDLDTVTEKGISAGRIYDLNSWLFESSRRVPFIENLIYDRNYKISAIVSEEYMKEQVVRYGMILVGIVGACVLAGTVLILLGFFADRLKNKGRRYVDIEEKHFADPERKENEKRVPDQNA